jgi:hypothetical protein
MLNPRIALLQEQGLQFCWGTQATCQGVNCFLHWTVAKLLFDISGWSSQSLIDYVNLLGINEPSILTFTNRHGQDIGDLAQDFKSCVDEDEDSFVAHPNDKLTGVDVHSGDNELPGLDTDFDTKPTGVEVDTEAYGDVPQEQNKVNGLRQQDPIAAQTEMPSAEPTTEPIAAP